MSIFDPPDITKLGQPRNEQDAMILDSLQRIKHTFLVMSGKGGVGKTSVSVNLAIALAGRGYKVGLMDVDIHGPDIPRMLGLEQMIGGDKNRKIIPVQFDHNLKVVSIESMMPKKDDAVIWRGPLKNTVIKQFIGETDWGDLDYLIIDSPPGTGDEPLSIAQTIKNAKAIIVTTPQEVSLADIRKSISFCNVVGMEVFGIIENMSGLECPHCHETINLFGSGGGVETAKAYEIPVLGQIPFDLNMVVCGDSGVVFQERFPDTGVSKTFAGIADCMIKNRVESNSETKSELVLFAIPLANGKLTAHFGHCDQFAMMYVKDGKLDRKETRTPPPHEPGTLPKWLKRLGTNVVIAGGMGQQAISLLNDQNIEVTLGAPELGPEALVSSYLDNTLVAGQNACDH